MARNSSSKANSCTSPCICIEPCSALRFISSISFFWSSSCFWYSFSLSAIDSRSLALAFSSISVCFSSNSFCTFSFRSSAFSLSSFSRFSKSISCERNALFSSFFFSFSSCSAFNFCSKDSLVCSCIFSDSLARRCASFSLKSSFSFSFFFSNSSTSSASLLRSLLKISACSATLRSYSALKCACIFPDNASSTSNSCAQLGHLILSTIIYNIPNSTIKIQNPYQAYNI